MGDQMGQEQQRQLLPSCQSWLFRALVQDNQLLPQQGVFGKVVQRGCASDQPACPSQVSNGPAPFGGERAGWPQVKGATTGFWHIA
jgi:hypothetical protein